MALASMDFITDVMLGRAVIILVIQAIKSVHLS